ncbi:response regulator transcription factor [Pontiellaceae bacterium B12227]|nr:response regulator transcription factor [Pontiellaceae bacterium B12227]
MKKSIRVMLVEDHPDYREIIAFALGKEKDIELGNQFGTAEEALRSLQDRSLRLVPDVILLDLNLPGINGLEALPYFKKSIPDSKVIVLTQSDNESDVLQAISQGAAGYLLKSATVGNITEGIRVVNGGGASLDANIAKFILNTLQTKLPENEVGNMLTERELETLSLLAEGLLKKEIADQLGISITTVATHVGNIYEKLQVQNAPAAVAKAFRMGIFTN